MPEDKDNKKERFLVDGYEFRSRSAYNQAQKEVERIAYIRANTDMKDPKELRRLYDSLTEKQSFSTPVGIGFLRELQRFLARDEKQRRNMRAIPVPGARSRKEKEAATAVPGMGRSELEERYRTKYRNQGIVIGFLVLLCGILFTFALFFQNLDAEAAREEVINEYAGWKEELEAKEKELKELEKELGQTAGKRGKTGTGDGQAEDDGQAEGDS